MGSAFGVEASKADGVIPSAIDTIFARIASNSNTDFAVRVGFVEIFTVSCSVQQTLKCAQHDASLYAGCKYS